jgi:hypothetical protein
MTPRPGAGVRAGAAVHVVTPAAAARRAAGNEWRRAPFQENSAAVAGQGCERNRL